MESQRLQTLADVLAFITAGNATFTIRSKATGNRFTFKIRKPSEDKPHFVSLLTGSNNEGDFTFFGTIFKDGTFRHGTRTSLVYDAPGPKAFAWFWKAIQHAVIPDTVEVWHEGRCGRCGRTLTVPESLARGLGPECASKYDCAATEAA